MNENLMKQMEEFYYSEEYFYNENLSKYANPASDKAILSELKKLGIKHKDYCCSPLESAIGEYGADNERCGFLRGVEYTLKVVSFNFQKIAEEKAKCQTS